jgi:hypothetical protein
MSHMRALMIDYGVLVPLEKVPPPEPFDHGRPVLRLDWLARRSIAAGKAWIGERDMVDLERRKERQARLAGMGRAA